MENQIDANPNPEGDRADSAADFNDSPMEHLTSDIREQLQAFFFDGRVLECVSTASVERGLVRSGIYNRSSNSNPSARDSCASNDESCA